MKNGIKVFSIFSLFFFLSFFLYFGFIIKTEFTNTYTKNEQNFAELKLRVLSIYLISSDLKTDYFSRRMHELLKSYHRLIAFSISDRSGTVLYTITKTRSILDNKNKSHAISNSLNPVFFTVFNAPISLSAANISSVKAVYRSFQVKNIYPILKNAFFAIITFLIITLIYLLYLVTARDIKGHTEIYSPFSNLVWKDHLMSSLENEIENSYAEKNNLTLSIISIDNFKNLPNKELIYLRIATILKTNFRSKKFLFEWYSGYAIIMRNTDIPEALLKIKELKKQIANSITGVSNVRISAGLSSRNGRYLNADTLYREANTALLKAQKEGNSIIAFNADPEKFKVLHLQAT